MVGRAVVAHAVIEDACCVYIHVGTDEGYQGVLGPHQDVPDKVGDFRGHLQLLS
jgi:hypothetical protein